MNVLESSEDSEDRRMQKCKRSLMEVVPKIFMRRLEREQCVCFDELSIPEKQLVNFNPSVFRVFIDFPDTDFALVKMLRKVPFGELDLTGESGNLRHPYDEELEWLNNAELIFNRQQEDVRSCAIMAFVPPRCFIFCDSKGIEDEERLRSISSGLKSYTVKSPVRNDEILPGICLVGKRADLLMRVLVLESDASNPMKVRCICLDFNAIYSFSRDDLYLVPDELSVNKVPTNAFLARFRGTYYIYEEKYQIVRKALCPPDYHEGIVNFVTCAVYGCAPDSITLVDTCMEDVDSWVSEAMVKAKMADFCDDDPEVKLSVDQAEQILKRSVSRRAAARIISCERQNRRPFRPRERMTYPMCSAMDASEDLPVDVTCSEEYEREVDGNWIPSGPSSTQWSQATDDGSVHECLAPEAHQMESSAGMMSKEERHCQEGDQRFDVNREKGDRGDRRLWLPAPDKMNRPVASTTQNHGKRAAVTSACSHINCTSRAEGNSVQPTMPESNMYSGTLGCRQTVMKREQQFLGSSNENFANEDKGLTRKNGKSVNERSLYIGTLDAKNAMSDRSDVTNGRFSSPRSELTRSNAELSNGNFGRCSCSKNFQNQNNLFSNPRNEVSGLAFEMFELYKNVRSLLNDADCAELDEVTGNMFANTLRAVLIGIRQKSEDVNRVQEALSVLDHLSSISEKIQ